MLEVSKIQPSTDYRIQNQSLLEEVRNLSPWLMAQASRVEQEGRIPPDVAERLIAARLFNMTAPSRFGGLEMSPADVWPVVYEVGRACSSSAWLVGLIAANILMLGKFSDQAQQEVFGSGRAPVVPMLTGGVGYEIKATPASNGIMLSGKWRYASGIDIANWVGLLVDLPEDGNRKASPAIVLVPASEFSIDHTSWNVLGMRGTGSKNVALADVFVPEHRFMDWSLLQSGGKHPNCSTDGDIYNLPLNSVFAMSVAAPTFGVASAVVDTYRDIVKTRVNSGTKKAQVDDRIAHIMLASAEATMSLVRDGLVLDANRLLDAVRTDRQMDVAERAEIRSRIARSSELARSEVQGIFASIGGSLLPSGTRIERLFRDVHAMSSHFLLQKDVIGELYGRLLLDLDIPATARI